ncbi:MAG TPA: metalloprotease [Leeuwenhoekiella sp.]|nr:metalloprotease [Leeuwenhoekiella sp.]
MSKFLPAFLVYILCCPFTWSQNSIQIKGKLNTATHTLQLQQATFFKNTSKDTLHEIVFNDWANSFSSKKSALGKRFAENYDRRFHLAKREYRGNTLIRSVADGNYQTLQFSRPEGGVDILKVSLKNPLYPGETAKISFFYEVKVPDARFTRYGVLDNGDYNLRYWFLSPAVYDGQWESYSNKNLDDLYMNPTDFDISLVLPHGMQAISEFEQESGNLTDSTSFKAIFTGKNRIKANIYLRKKPNFEFVETDNFKVFTNIIDDKEDPNNRAFIIDKVSNYLTKELGSYPFDKLLLSEEDYRDNPVYGLNQLPDFISPFPSGFQYELQILKTEVNQFVENTMLFNPRKDRWVADAIQIYLMMRYVDKNYPKLKVIGNLEKYWLLRQYNISKLEFNDQYNLLYLHMARLNLDQPLNTPHDSLIKFNKNIANAYKAGSGLNYLQSYIGNHVIDSTITQFYETEKLKPVSSTDFEQMLRATTDKNLDWFFDDYVTTRVKIDYKLEQVKKRGDSLYIKIQNKRDNTMPIPLYGMQGDSVISSSWLEGFKGKKVIAIKADGIDRIALNKDGVAPEFNRRNNYKKVNPFLGIHKPIQFKLLQDLENPAKSQVFFMPIFEYNFYDGLSLGARMYNKTLLSKAFSYSVEPQFGLKSKALVGSLGLSYTQNIEDGNLYAVRYGISASTQSFAPDAFYNKYSPFMTFAFRTDDFRSDKRQFLTISNINVSRDESEFITNEDPDYNVFNVRYTNSSPGVINAFSWNTDFQLAKKFSKISATAKYKKVFLNNRQFDFRLFAGTFLYNETRTDGDFFSFALDRPTDYLFNYNYYGRSESSGLFSQQLIIAEGGFKSKLDSPFANEWMATANASTTLYRFLHVYGDVGMFKSRGNNARFAFDSGIRAVLVEDYFELYLPVLSSKGWEIAQPDYDQKIRFIVTLSLRTLLNLFTRKWY